jgi:hypothetical protein
MTPTFAYFTPTGSMSLEVGTIMLVTFASRGGPTTVQASQVYQLDRDAEFIVWYGIVCKEPHLNTEELRVSSHC